MYNAKSVLVDVIMTTFNHEYYIKDAIESVLNQKTGFRYRLIIANDSSSDRTALICKYYAERYPEIIIYLENDINKGLLANYHQCFKISYSKYIAILEGDDYWIDDAKLQNQADILEEDVSIGLVHTDYKVYYQEINKLKNRPSYQKRKSKKKQGYIFDELVKENFICSLTVMFRSSLIREIDFNYMYESKYSTIDYHFWLEMSLISKVYYLDKICGVYRVSNSSVSNNKEFYKKNKFAQTRINTLAYFYGKKYNRFDLDAIKREFINVEILRAIKSGEYSFVYNNIDKINIIYMMRILYKALLRI